MNIFKCLISAQCMGYWLQKDRNIHRITQNRAHGDNTWGERQEHWEMQGCPQQEQLYRARQGQSPCPPAALTLGTAKHPSTLPLNQTEFQVYNVNFFTILKGFLWLKEIYNQDDNPQDSMNLWRQNYRVRARKHPSELPQILIFFLNNFAQK